MTFVILKGLWTPGDERISRRARIYGGLALLAVAAIAMAATWETWGDLSIDGGHELYVPAALAQGQVLYKDVWYHYGPTAPYFNSLLFRLFGPRLLVLYFSGALAAWGSGLFVFLTGCELSFAPQGWIAAAIVIVQAFKPGLFSFPLSYSFAAAYGCLAACGLLWLLVRSFESARRAWRFAAACVAALALSLKPEYGAVCYLGFAVASTLRAARARSWRPMVTDAVLSIPGILACATIAWWMVSLRGLAFITQENIMSLPGSFFMRTYGKAYMASVGLSLDWPSWRMALLNMVFVAGMVTALATVACWPARGPRATLTRVAMFSAPVLFYLWAFGPASPARIFADAYFPPSMLIWVLISAAIVTVLWLRRAESRAVPTIFTFWFAGILAFRVLLHVESVRYSIYYNGPAILAYLLLVSVLLRGAMAPRQQPSLGVVLACVTCLDAGVMPMLSNVLDWPKTELLQTAHGNIRPFESVAESYRAAIAFMRDKAARHEAVLVVPEDTSLYFFADIRTPTRVYAFDPGVLAPGRMTTELFEEIETHSVRYLLWSDRTFPEYGAPKFGRDFNRELGDYLVAHFREIGPLIPGRTPQNPSPFELNFTVWQRKDPTDR